LSVARSSRTLAAALREETLRRLRADPQLWTEYRRRAPWSDGWTLLSCCLFLFGLCLFGLVSAPEPRTYFWVSWACLGAIATTSYATVFAQGIAGFRKRLAHLPHESADLFDLQRWLSLRSLVFWGFVYLLYAAAGVLILSREGTLTPQQLGLSAVGLVLLGLAQAALVHPFGLLVLRVVPARSCEWLLLGFTLVLGVTIVGPMSAPATTARGLVWLEAHSSLLLLIPTVWLPQGALALTDAQPERALVLLPLLGLVLATPALGAALRARPWGEIADELNREEEPDMPPLLERDEALDLIRRGEWLYDAPEEATSARNWLDRALLLLLSERQRWLYRFLRPESDWTLRWWLGVFGLVLGLVMALFPVGWLRLGSVVVFAVFGVAALPIPGETWSGQGLVRVAGGWVPRYATYPLSQRELLAVRLRVSYGRALAYLLLAVLCAGPLALFLGKSAQDGWLLAARLAVLYLGILPAIVASSVRSAERDRAFSCLGWPLLALWALTLTAGAVLLFVAPSGSVRAGVTTPFEFVAASAWSALGAGLVWGCGGFAYWLYLWLQRRSDLLRTKPPEGEVS